MNETLVKIRELNLDLISPSSPLSEDGSKIVVIGSSGSGKSTIIKSLIYNKHKLIPAGMVMCGSEDAVNEKSKYGRYIPNSFVHNRFDEEAVCAFIKRQKLAKQQNLANPWAFLLLDDVTDDPKIFNTRLFHDIFKMGRHWKMLFILSLQYSMDIRPALRAQITGTFILRESNLKVRKSLFENYAGIIPDFATFCDILDQLTGDYTALYIHNATQSNNWEDNIFWYKAKPIPAGFKFGGKDYWRFHEERYNEEYVDTF